MSCFELSYKKDEYMCNTNKYKATSLNRHTQGQQTLSYV